VPDRYPKPASRGAEIACEPQEARRRIPAPNRRRGAVNRWPQTRLGPAIRRRPATPSPRSTSTPPRQRHAARAPLRTPPIGDRASPASAWRLRVPTCHPYPQVRTPLAPDDGNALSPSPLSTHPPATSSFDDSTWAARARQDPTR